MPRTYLIIPDALQLAQIALGAHNAHHQMPPEGMSLHIEPDGEWLNAADSYFATHLPIFLAGSVPAGQEDDWYWGTVGDIVTSALIPDSIHRQWLLEKLAALASSTLGDIFALPLLKKGTANTTMRWLRATYKGTLAGVETFQHKLDLGQPGADPDISEEEALTMATALAASWKSAFNEYQTNITNPEVKYTEVGVAQITQTDASDAEGEGGNPEYAFATQWFAYPLGEEAVGTAVTASLPFEVACAITLLTDHRGPSGRGRFYLPPFSGSVMAAAGRFNTTALGNVGTAIGHHLDDIKTDLDVVPVVVSGRRLILNEIKQVLIGGVPDSQRRRRRSQDEARLTAWTSA